MDYQYIKELEKAMNSCDSVIDVQQYLHGPLPDKPGKYWIYATGSFPAYFDGEKWTGTDQGFSGLIGYSPMLIGYSPDELEEK